MPPSPSPTYVRDPALVLRAETWKDPVPVFLVNGSISTGDVTLSGAVEIKDASGNLAEVPKANAAKDGNNHVILTQNVDDEGGILRRSDIVDIDLNTATTNVLLVSSNDKLAAIEESGTRTLAALGVFSAVGVPIDRSGTIVAGGVSQQVMASNTSRKYLLFENVSSEDMWINFTVPAVMNQPSMRITAPGGSFVMESTYVASASLNVISATPGSAFTAKEG